MRTNDGIAARMKVEAARALGDAEETLARIKQYAAELADAAGSLTPDASRIRFEVFRSGASSLADLAMLYMDQRESAERLGGILDGSAR